MSALLGRLHPLGTPYPGLGSWRATCQRFVALATITPLPFAVAIAISAMPRSEPRADKLDDA